METTDLLKQILIIAVLMFIPFQILNGQDKIITIQNDTIHGIDSNYQIGSPKPKRVKKHYLGHSLTVGMNSYGNHGSTLSEDFFGIGIIEYAYRKGNVELGTGLNISNLIPVIVPLSLKQYLGEYFFIGFGTMIGYEQNEGLCIGAIVMTGFQVVSKSGFSFSLSPNLRYSSMFLGIMHIGFTVGIGYSF